MSSFVLPTPPRTLVCPKCDRDVVIAVNPGKPGLETECPDPECPIARDPENQPSGEDGTLICFSEPEITEEGRRARFAQWEEIGLDRVKHDLVHGGYEVVGGPPVVRKLAWTWVRQKEQEQLKPKPDEILQLKPTAWGIGIDLKALWRKIFGKQ